MGSGGPAGASTARRVQRSFKLARGVRLTTIRLSADPNEIRVVTITQGHHPEADVLPAGPRYPAYRRPSAIAAGASALAAVNGDFAQDGRPKHFSMMDAEPWSTGLQAGVSFAAVQGGKRAYVGVPDPRIAALPHGASAITVNRWNAGWPKGTEVGAYSQHGGSVEQPPGHPNPTATSPRWCAVRLVPSGRIRWADTTHKGWARDYTVDAQPEPCPKTPEPMGSTAGAVVLAAHAPTAGGQAILALKPGQAVQLRWRLLGWPGAIDVISGTPQLVSHGRKVGPPYHAGDSYFYDYNPRTAVGVSKGCEDKTGATVCKTFIVTVDGRRDGWSHGMRFPELAAFMKDLGAYDAVNLDGGGGTELWVRDRKPAYCEKALDVGGCLADKPADPTGERASVTSLEVLPGSDPGEPGG